VSWAEKNVKLDNATAMNKIRVHLDHRVHRDHREKTDYQAATESKAFRAPRALPHRGSISRHHPDVAFAHRVHEGHLDHLAPQALVDRKVYPAKLVEMEMMVDPALLVTLDLPVKPESPAYLDRKETMVAMPKLLLKDRQDQLEHLVKMAHLDPMANQARQATPAPLDPPARLDHLAKMESLVRMDHQDPKEDQACLARTPNIVRVRNAVPLFWQPPKPRPKPKLNRIWRRAQSREINYQELKNRSDYRLSNELLIKINFLTKAKNFGYKIQLDC